jgi:hypothetical protein
MSDSGDFNSDLFRRREAYSKQPHGNKVLRITKNFGIFVLVVLVFLFREEILSFFNRF